MTSIGVGAFQNCENLLNVYCYAEEPPLAFSSFDYVENSQATLRVPAGSVDSYRKSVTWNVFGNIVPLTPAEMSGGDINGDGVVDVADIVCLINLMGAPETDVPAADLNGDGEIGSSDVEKLVEIIMTKKY